MIQTQSSLSIAPFHELQSSPIKTQLSINGEFDNTRGNALHESQFAGAVAVTFEPDPEQGGAFTTSFVVSPELRKPEAAAAIMHLFRDRVQPLQTAELGAAQQQFTDEASTHIINTQQKRGLSVIGGLVLSRKDGGEPQAEFFAPSQVQTDIGVLASNLAVERRYIERARGGSQRWYVLPDRPGLKDMIKMLPLNGGKAELDQRRSLYGTVLATIIANALPKSEIRMLHALGMVMNLLPGASKPADPSEVPVARVA